MMERPSDLELRGGVRAGHAAAFAELFDRHGRSVYNYCFRRTADWSLAEDCLSVVFLEAWRHREDVQLAEGSLLPWLLGIANNVVRNQARSLRRYQAALRRLPPATADDDVAEEVAGRVDDQRRMRAVLELVGRLPVQEQEALALCGWSGLSYRQAAAALGVPVGTVRSRLSRARARLREALAEPGGARGQRWGEHSPVLRRSRE